MSNDNIYERISEVISEYRNNEFGAYNDEHVERWASQFTIEEQQIVLPETLRILKRNYITLDNFQQFVQSVIDSPTIYKSDKQKYWQSVSLLDIQQNGNSQKELNDILASTLKERFNVDNTINKESTELIYLDDFIFSGNRLLSDIKQWIVDKAPQSCRVQIITIGWHTSGQWHSQNKLKEIAREHGKDIKFDFASFKSFRLENRLFRKDSSEVFWPTESITHIPKYETWLNSESFEPKYRTVNGIKNKIFSNPRREEYEQIMFKYGLDIMSFSEQNSVVVKPLGYSTYRGFGFGSTVFSFRNCPNNNPLAFWWGDPSASRHHPFSKWYPLLQRKTYG